jgi:hypothetical protein
MGPFLTSLFVALGAGTWIYSRLQQHTGYGNSHSAIVGAGLSAAGIFAVLYLTMRLFGM